MKGERRSGGFWGGGELGDGLLELDEELEVGRLEQLGDLGDALDVGLQIVLALLDEAGAHVAHHLLGGERGTLEVLEDVWELSPQFIT